MAEIKHVESSTKGSFDIYFEGEKAGSLTYTWAGEDKFIIDHTEVDPKFSGKGLAKDLVVAAVSYAREKGKKVIPLCTYANATIRKNAELQDVLA